jgi:hypothetical protein
MNEVHTQYPWPKAAAQHQPRGALGLDDVQVWTPLEEEVAEFALMALR